jgi:uncharacterized protein YecT (DUF1311 family)
MQEHSAGPPHSTSQFRCPIAAGRHRPVRVVTRQLVGARSARDALKMPCDREIVMGKGIAAVSALLLFTLGSPCLAGQPVAMPSATKCYALPNAEATNCLFSVAEALEPILQRYYEAALSSIERRAAEEQDNIAADLHKGVSDLEHAQSSWRAYRDAHCDMVSELFMNGSGRAAGGVQCTIDLTRLRIHELWESGGFQPRNLPEPK